MAALTRPTTSRRWRILRENLTAYAFLTPAMILIFIFGIAPVGFAFFVSVRRWRRFPGEYLALDSYGRALGDAAYIAFFAIAIGALAFAAYRVWTFLRQHADTRSALIPASLWAWAITQGTAATLAVLPIILEIPQRVRNQARTRELFVEALGESFTIAPIPQMFGAAILASAIALVVTLVWLGWKRRQTALDEDAPPPLNAIVIAVIPIVTAVFAAILLGLTLDAISQAHAAALAAGDPLPIWAQTIIIGAGAGLLAAAWWVWRRGAKQHGDRSFVASAGAAVMLAVGGYALISTLPRALGGSDPELLSAFSVTVMFVLGTVPFQLVIGLGLAYFLFQNIRGKAFFRMMYFLPYITPFVATAIVFGLLFSFRAESPANQILTGLGIPVQRWLQEPTGIVQLIFGDGVPDWLAGPSLALIVIMIYSVWTYIGYNAVIFLAGLGNISGELYEAARIDGASEWHIFRHITIPLLSPTTFFLSLIAIIGTFQAFTQIWILRDPAAARSVDTVGVVIFEWVQQGDPNMGYGSALSMVLFVVILLLTLFQNRILGRSVFYG